MMNLLRSKDWKILSLVRLVLGRMADIKKGFSDNSDDRQNNDVQLLRRASVKRESRTRPTKTVWRISNHRIQRQPIRAGIESLSDKFIFFEFQNSLEDLASKYLAISFLIGA